MSNVNDNLGIRLCKHRGAGVACSIGSSGNRYRMKLRRGSPMASDEFDQIFQVADMIAKWRFRLGDDTVNAIVAISYRQDDPRTWLVSVLRKDPSAWISCRNDGLHDLVSKYMRSLQVATIEYVTCDDDSMEDCDAAESEGGAGMEGEPGGESR
jgi:hypothetical protein